MLPASSSSKALSIMGSNFKPLHVLTAWAKRAQLKVSTFTTNLPLRIFTLCVGLVYCYYAENTVERNILDLAARQGLSLYTKDNAAGTLNVSSFELDDTKKVIDSPTKKKTQKGDFIFQCVPSYPCLLSKID